MSSSKRYATVLFDLDHTLLDSDTSMAVAYERTMLGFGVDQPWSHHPTFERINAGLWGAVERQEIGPEEVRTRRFEQLAEALELTVDPGAMAERFVHELGANGDLYPGVREVLEELRSRVTMAIVTNGIGEVQRARIHRLGLERYMSAIVISGEMGVAKPAPAIFDLVFDELGRPELGTALMVGDSLTSDMRGGERYGIDTAWFNPSGSPLPDGRFVTHEIGDLAELYDLVEPVREPA